MRPVSTKFLSSLRGSHGRTAQAFVVAPGQTGTTPTGTEIPILDGNVQLDATAQIRSTLDLTTDGTGEWPNQVSDLFTPYGNEVFVRVGMVFGGGVTEWVSLGYFRIFDVGQDEAPNGPLRISGQDRMSGIVDARLVQPQQFLATATYGAVVTSLVQEVFPTAVITWDDLSYTDALGRAVIAEEDRFEFLDDLIKSKGKIWYWDYRGYLVIKDVPPEDDPVWDVNAGENGVLVSLSRELSREGVYNGVVAYGDALDNVTPARAVAVDNNPTSPTYWNGNFGKVPRFYSSPFITTINQAQSAANSLLRQKLGLPYNVDFSAVPNAALEPWDPVAVNIVGTRNPQPAQNIVSDGFNRTVVDSLGTADSGQAWTNPGSGFYDVNGSEATISIPTSNVLEVDYITGVSQHDVDGYMKVSVPNLATGASLIVGAGTRYSTAGSVNGYLLAIEFNTAGTVTCKIRKYVANVFTEIASYNPVPGLTYSANQVWVVKFRNSGNTLKMKIWPDGAAEPSSWTLETTDSSVMSGSVGIWSWHLSVNTNTGVQVKVHDFVVNAYQGLKPGDEVHVIETLNIPLTNDQPMKATTREQTLVVIGEEA